MKNEKKTVLKEIIITAIVAIAIIWIALIFGDEYGRNKTDFLAGIKVQELLFSSASGLVFITSLFKWIFSENHLQNTLKFSLISFFSLMALLASTTNLSWSIAIGIAIAILAIPLYRLADKDSPEE